MSLSGAFDAQVNEYLGRQTHLRSAARQRGLPVCSTCSGPVGLLDFSSTDERYELCKPCSGYRKQQVVGSGLADAVFPLLYASAGKDQTGRDMWNYKDSRYGQPGDNPAFAGLASVLYVALRYHWRCLQATTGRTPNRVTVIPSTKNPGQVSPLAHLAARVLDALKWEIGAEELLDYSGEPTSGGGKQRGVVDTDLFGVHGLNRGDDVLLVEDTWVSGSHAQSGAAALKKAGANSVTVLVVARWLDPTHTAARYLFDAIPHSPQPSAQVCPFAVPGISECVAEM